MGQGDPSGTVVLSPHADDAALSLGGSLIAQALPLPVSIVTIFGLSNFMNGAFHPDATAVTQRREREDHAYAASVGVDLEFWSYAEASLRTNAASGLFSEAPDSPDEPLGLTEDLAWLLQSRRPELLALPLGLGGHRDHVLVQKLGHRLAPSHRVPVAYYEDLPYAASKSLSSIRAHVRRIDPALKPWVVSIAGELPAKLSRLGHYPSQLGVTDLEKVATHASRRSWWDLARSVRARRRVQYPIERIWHGRANSLGRYIEHFGSQ